MCVFFCIYKENFTWKNYLYCLLAIVKNNQDTTLDFGIYSVSLGSRIYSFKKIIKNIVTVLSDGTGMLMKFSDFSVIFINEDLC